MVVRPAPRAALPPMPLALRWSGPSDAALATLRRAFRLYDLVDPGQTELEQLLSLRDWVHQRWDHHSDNTPDYYDSLHLLQRAAQGDRYRCVEYSYVLADVYRALGWQARLVRLQGTGGAHAVTEVYAQTLGSWILMDGQHAAWVKERGRPCSVQEVLEALRNGRSSILEAEVRGAPLDYLAWLAPYTTYAMYPADLAYGHQLDTLLVDGPPGVPLPDTKPDYLRRQGTRYLKATDRTLLYPATVPVLPSVLKASKSAVLTAQQMREDLDELVELLDQSHPDPYVRGGGRIAFARRVQEIRRAIPESSTKGAFSALLRPLVASVGDGHTALALADADVEKKQQSQFEFSAVHGRLYVAGVRQAADSELLGGRVFRVGNTSLSDLVKRMRQIQGADNDYQNLVHLAQALQSPEQLAELLQQGSAWKQAVLEVMLPGEKLRRIPLRFEEVRDQQLRRPATVLALPEANAAGLAWAILPGKPPIGYLRIDSSARYREAFEAWRHNGAVGNLRQHLAKVAADALKGKPLPDSIDERIAAIPSATEAFLELHKTLRSSKAAALVVDVRNNRGGNSLLADLLLRLLLPPAARSSLHNERQIPRYSQLLFAEHRSATISDARKASGDPFLRVGDYDFSEEALAQSQRPLLEEAAAARLKSLTDAAPTFAKALQAGVEPGAFTGRLAVVLGATTYSAGFDIALRLADRKAKLVGVPSSQAPNCFIDTLSFRLQHSGIRGHLSYKRSDSLPGDDLRGALYPPDLELSFPKLAEMSFDPNASVLLALKSLGWYPAVGK